MAREDPLATQVWKMYARNKAALPHAQRMENLTWRMMTLALKKKEEAKLASRKDHQISPSLSDPQRSESVPTGPSTLVETPASVHATIKTEPEVRGRRTDKTMARVRVVGFEGKNQDGEDEEGNSDGEDGEAELIEPPYTVKLIDFAHTYVTPGEGPDESTLFGLDTVLQLLDGRIEQIRKAAS